MIDTTNLVHELPGRRWFGGKGRAITAVSVIDEAVIDEARPRLTLALASVTYSDASTDLYHLPLLVDDDGSCRDAFEDVERLRVLGTVMARGTTIRGRRGAFRFGGAGLDPLSPPGDRSIRAVGAEQSNSSFILDDHVIVKLFRRVQPGPNPDLELSRVLTNEGFDNIPAQVGEIVYEGDVDERDVDEDGPVEIDVAMAQTFVADAVEGWERVLADLRALYDSADPATPAEALPELVEERASEVLVAIEALGDVTAGLHVTLAREELEPEFAPEPVETGDLKRWIEATKESLVRTASSVSDIAALRPALEHRIDRLAAIQDAGVKLRIHGDYHLGQVLLATKGWLVLDFEGEPARSLDERRAKQSPLKDVAGMLRSLGYAAAAVLFERSEPETDEWRALQPWADAWEAAARERFLHAYLRSAHEGRFLPSDRDEVATMLDFFELDKALYEIGYELGHRPGWVRIPLRGIVGVVERGQRP